MLYNLLGVAALIASLCFVIAVPVQYQLAKLQARVQKHALVSVHLLITKFLNYNL